MQHEKNLEKHMNKEHLLTKMIHNNELQYKINKKEFEKNLPTGFVILPKSRRLPSNSKPILKKQVVDIIPQKINPVVSTKKSQQKRRKNKNQNKTNQDMEIVQEENLPYVKEIQSKIEKGRKEIQSMNILHQIYGPKQNEVPNLPLSSPTKKPKPQVEIKQVTRKAKKVGFIQKEKNPVQFSTLFKLYLC